MLSPLRGTIEFDIGHKGAGVSLDSLDHVVFTALKGFLKGIRRRPYSQYSVYMRVSRTFGVYGGVISRICVRYTSRYVRYLSIHSSLSVDVSSKSTLNLVPCPSYDRGRYEE